MNDADRKYFLGKANYQTPKIMAQYPGAFIETCSASCEIRNTAKDALDNIISSSKGRSKISLLLRKINKLKKQTIQV